MVARKKSKVYCVYYSKSPSEEFEVHARKASPSDLLGFIELSDFVYPKKTQIIIEPDGEKSEKEFKNVHKTFIPIRDIRRIDEYESDALFAAADLKVVRMKKKQSTK